jgi:hypothetical protein
MGIIQEELTFWQLLIFEDQQRTVGETHARINKLKTMINGLMGDTGPHTMLDELTKLDKKKNQ